MALAPEQLIEALSDPTAWPWPVDEVEIVQTHISLVFLAGEHVLKIKKPLDLGFLDFTTLASRRRFCDAEVSLNRRLAPGVYLGVVPIGQRPEGLRIGDDREVVEVAVHMARLPDEATLKWRLRHGQLDEGLLERAVARIAAFHAGARRDADTAAQGRFEVVAGNARENFDQTRDHVGHTVHPEVHARLERLTEEALARHRGLIEARAQAMIPCDGHGDLRLEHIYRLPDVAPPDDLVIIDAVEFNERFRFADPVLDVAFLLMELMREGHPELAQAAWGAYRGASEVGDGEALLPLYVGYRAVVRAKVRGIKALEPEVPEAEAADAAQSARAHWLTALAAMAPPAEAPRLVGLCGLPGSGKSTLARGLADAADFEVISTDATRKRLAGLAPDDDGAAAGIYTPEWTERTYRAALDEAGARLFEGGRVLVDGNFGEARWREALVALGRRWGVPTTILECRVSPQEARARLQARQGDVSDADWAIHQLQASRQEPTVPSPWHRALPEDASPEATLAHARAIIARLGFDPAAGG